MKPCCHCKIAALCIGGFVLSVYRHKMAEKGYTVTAPPEAHIHMYNWCDRFAPVSLACPRLKADKRVWGEK